MRELVEKHLGSGLRERLQSLLETDLIWALLLMGGAVVRLRQFTADLSVGNDEAALARNIVERSFGGLTQPLGYRQGAPVLFLFIQKALLLALGNRDFILELFPLFSGCVALYLFCRIAKRHLGLSGLPAVVAFSLSAWLITYSADLKQYSSDIMAALLLVELGDRCLEQTAHAWDFVLLGMAGAVAIWLSHPAAFILPAIGLAVLLTKIRRKERAVLAWVLGMGGVWAAAFALDYVVVLRHLATDVYLQKYWQPYFMPMPPWSHPSWFLDALSALMLPSTNGTDLAVLLLPNMNGSGLFTTLLWMTVVLIGCLSLLAGSRIFAGIVLLPFALTLAASALHKYPIWDRLLLFLIPFVYLLLAEGLRRVYRTVARWRRTPALVTYAILVLVILWPMAVSAKRNFFNPPHHWDMRPIVEYMSAKWEPGDEVFVSGGGETFNYYAEMYGLQPAQLITENTHRLVRYFLYKSAMNAYAGRNRVWVVFAYFEDGSYLYGRYPKYLRRLGEIKAAYEAGVAHVYLVKFDP